MSPLGNTLHTGRGHDPEAGMSLVEIAVAMVVFGLVIGSVGMSVTVLNGRSNGMSQSNQSIDQLQVAEQLIVRDLHAAKASAWYSTTACTGTASTSLPSTGTSTPVPSYPFSFVVALPHSPCVEVNLASNQLTVITAGGGQTVVSNLTSSSALTPDQVTWTPTDGKPTETFTISTSVVLTTESPRLNAPHEVSTTISDPEVVVFNGVYACETYWTNNPGSGTSPC
jgi:Tfp pilus assembly protein PilV